MGLSLASREEYIYDENGILLDTSLRNYKVMHIGQEPKYLVDFVETPQIDSPFGTRAFSEHGIIGMPAALGNALSLATGIELNELPITPETIFKNAYQGRGKLGNDFAFDGNAFGDVPKCNQVQKKE